jgi:hypothetical protein
MLEIFTKTWKSLTKNRKIFIVCKNAFLMLVQLTIGYRLLKDVSVSDYFVFAVIE